METLKFGVSYRRKVRVMAYETFEIGYWEEFVVGVDDPEEAFKKVVDRVEKWISMRRGEILDKSLKRPKRKVGGDKP